MADYTPERITGPRLLLRLPVLDDAGTLFQCRVARDPQVTKYLLWTPHPDVAATRRGRERINVGEHDRTWVIVAAQRRDHRDDQLLASGPALR